jgi:hypothetical protein
MAQCSECRAETLLYVSTFRSATSAMTSGARRSASTRLRNRTTKRQGDPATDCQRLEASNNGVVLALPEYRGSGMPVSYHISPVIACIIVRLEGSVSDDDLLEEQQRMFSDPLFKGH